MKRLFVLPVVFCIGAVHAATVTSQLDENRILLFDDYYATNNLPQPTWVHEGVLPVCMCRRR